MKSIRAFRASSRFAKKKEKGFNSVGLGQVMFISQFKNN